MYSIMSVCVIHWIKNDLVYNNLINISDNKSAPPGGPEAEHEIPKLTHKWLKLLFVVQYPQGIYFLKSNLYNWDSYTLVVT